MKYFSILLVIGILFCPVILLAQDVPSLKEIKRSGKYYSGDGYDADTLKAREAARSDLMSNISKQIKDDGSFKGKSEILVKYIQYLMKPLGNDGYTKVVAFVPIENVKRIVENKESLAISEMIYTEAEAPFQSNKIPDKPDEITVAKSEVQEMKTEEQVIGSVAKKDILPPVPKTLLEQLIACNTSTELGTLLEKGKSDNKLLFSISEAFRRVNSPENFYIVLIDPDTKKIMSFFDKGSAVRKDLKYGKKSANIENDAKNLIQVWIQLF